MHAYIVYTLIAAIILHYSSTGTVIYALTIAYLATQCNVHWHGHCIHALVSCHTLLLLHIQS